MGLHGPQVLVVGPQKGHGVKSVEGKIGFMHVEDKISFLTFANVTPITLISDFGPDSLYVGMLKGSILRRMPDARVVDLTHSIRQFDAVHAAFVLRVSMDSFPPGTVHIVAVQSLETPDHPHRIVKMKGQFIVLGGCHMGGCH